MQPMAANIHGRVSDQTPALIATPSSQEETALPIDGEMHGEPGESGVYTAEEEALVEERLKNLGYL